ncbi:DNA mismatch repair protein MutS, partial [Pavlovales sp. CCMP2436]
RAVVLTGPNMGGKTTALKSFGCAALMARAGLRVPVESEPLSDSQTGAARPLATVPFYSLVLADIGDGQSLRKVHSTFAAHMTCVIEMRTHAQCNTLCLLDELGLGTQAEEGLALACATIETPVRTQGAFIIGNLLNNFIRYRYPACMLTN